MSWVESVPGIRKVNELGYLGLEKTLHYFGGWAEERNRAVGYALALGFAGFLKGDENCLFPDGGYFSVALRKVINLAEVLQFERTKMTEVEDGEVARASLSESF